MSADSRVVATVQARTEVVAAPLSVDMLLVRRATIREAIDKAMEEGVHYGIIPGTGNRLSLLKEGAEMLLSMFHIAVEPVVTDLSTPTEVRFRVECRGIVNGVYVGSGIGICSSNEEKYRWRKPKTNAEWDDTDPSMRKVKYGVYNGKEYKDKVVRQSPYDAIQTVLSMAEKRAKVDLAKGALAASECLKGKQSSKWGPSNKAKDDRRPPPSDAPEKWAGNSGGNGAAGGAGHAQTKTSAPAASASIPGQGGAGKPATAQTTEPPPPKLVGEEEIDKICRILDQSGIPDSAFLGAFEIGLITELEVNRMEAALAWLERNSP